MNRILTQGDHLQLEGKEFCIIRGIGAGASCVVYLAECADCTQHLLKEYNPRRLELYREGNGTLCIEDEDDAEKYADGLNRFAIGAEKQKTIRRSIDELTNSTSNVQGVYAANGTMYIDMTVFRGQSYENVREQSMFDLLRRMRALTQVISSYHNSGYLHLDIKPENIFAIPETCEMVMLFDFDSVVEKTAIQAGAMLSYTKSWAAPEQVRGCARQICEATDLFSVGEMVFWQVFGRHSAESERRSYARFAFDMDAAICKNVNPKLFPLLEDLFHHTLCFDVKKRYQSAEELLTMLDRLIPLADPKEPYLVSAQVVPEDFFIGRENELASIHESLQANHVLFLSGMGGIGKSELAKNYAKQFPKDYDTVLFATYMGSWQMLITDDLGIHIANFERYWQEPEKDYCARKIPKLAELCDERTLLIIDNVNEDVYEGEESELFKRLMGLNCQVLLTSRLRDWEYPTLEIGTFGDRTDMLRLFAKWCPYKAAQEPTVKAIIEYVAGHTLTVELIAKQVRAGFSTPDKMLQKLKAHGVGNSGKEAVKSSKDNVVSRKTPFEHICDLFDVAKLKEIERKVLINLSMLPPVGIELSRFMKWCELDNPESINCLFIAGWIERESEKIKMHPIISDVVRQQATDFIFVSSMIRNVHFDIKSGSYSAFQLRNCQVIETICTRVLNSGVLDIDLVPLVVAISPALRNFGELESAEFLLLKCIDFPSCSDEQRIVANLELAKTNVQSGKMEKALLRVQAAENTLYRGNVGVRNNVEVYDDLGCLLSELYISDKAERYFKRGLRVSKKTLEKNPRAIEIYIHLANLYCKILQSEHFDLSHRFSISVIAPKLRTSLLLHKANTYYNIAQRRAEEVYGNQSVEYAEICLSIARGLDSPNKNNILVKKLASDAEAILVAQNVDTCRSLLDANRLKGDYEGALQIAQKLFGQENATIAQIYEDYGIKTLYEDGDYEHAEKYLNESLKIYTSIYGKDSAHSARIYLLLGELYNQKKKILTPPEIENYLHSGKSIQTRGKVLLALCYVMFCVQLYMLIQPYIGICFLRSSAGKPWKDWLYFHVYNFVELSLPFGLYLIFAPFISLLLIYLRLRFPMKVLTHLTHLSVTSLCCYYSQQLAIRWADEVKQSYEQIIAYDYGIGRLYPVAVLIASVLSLILDWYIERNKYKWKQDDKGGAVDEHI